MDNVRAMPTSKDQLLYPIAIVFGALLLGAKRNTQKYTATVTWNGWCDKDLGFSCMDWDYNIDIRKPILFKKWNTEKKEYEWVVEEIRENSSWVLGYDYDAANSNSYEPVLSATLDAVKRHEEELVTGHISGDYYRSIPDQDINWENIYTDNFKRAQEATDWTQYKTEIKQIVGAVICYYYPATCPVTCPECVQIEDLLEGS